jgi:hypothetical protein
MSTLEQIETAILALPTADVRRLSVWLSELDQQRWDEELEKDIANGRLEKLAEEAIAEYQAGKTRVI